MLPHPIDPKNLMNTISLTCRTLQIYAVCELASKEGSLNVPILFKWAKEKVVLFVWVLICQIYNDLKDRPGKIKIFKNEISFADIKLEKLFSMMTFIVNEVLVWGQMDTTFL